MAFWKHALAHEIRRNLDAVSGSRKHSTAIPAQAMGS
jgi:hypothetical protein